MVKKKDVAARPTPSSRPRIVKDFLKTGQDMNLGIEELRRQNLARLVGTDRFPTWKSISDALGYADQSRISHLKQGYRAISADLARGMEESLGLPVGYFDSDPRKASASNPISIAAVDRKSAAKRYLDRSTTARDLAAEYEVEEAMIYRWVAEYRRESAPEAAQERTSSGRTLADVEAENEKLRNKLLKFMLADD